MDPLLAGVKEKRRKNGVKLVIPNYKFSWPQRVKPSRLHVMWPGRPGFPSFFIYSCLQPLLLQEPLISVSRCFWHLAGTYRAPFYSLRIAARGLSLIALSAGKYPAAIPTNTANTREAITSHGGI